VVWKKGKCPLSQRSLWRLLDKIPPIGLQKAGDWMTDIYVRLSYDEYKEFERQLERWKELEHTHYHGGYYHKSFRIKIGSIMLEVHGPQVKVSESD